MDANTSALNKMLDNQEEQEKALEDFQKESETILKEINNLIKELKYLKDSYRYDFTEDLNDMIKEIVWQQ